MSREELNFLQSFATGLGVPVEFGKTRTGYVVYTGEQSRGRHRECEEFWDAMAHVVHSASAEAHWWKTAA